MADRIGVINKGELVVVEDKDTLMRRLGRKQLTLVLQAPLERIPDELSALPLELSDDRQSLVYTFDTQTEETGRSEEHTSELQSLMRHSSAVFCLKKNKK